MMFGLVVWLFGLLSGLLFVVQTPPNQISTTPWKVNPSTSAVIARSTNQRIYSTNVKQVTLSQHPTAPNVRPETNIPAKTQSENATMKNLTYSRNCQQMPLSNLLRNSLSFSPGTLRWAISAFVHAF